MDGNSVRRVVHSMCTVATSKTDFESRTHRKAILRMQGNIEVRKERERERKGGNNENEIELVSQ